MQEKVLCRKYDSYFSMAFKVVLSTSKYLLKSVQKKIFGIFLLEYLQ